MALEERNDLLFCTSTQSSITTNVAETEGNHSTGHSAISTVWVRDIRATPFLHRDTQRPDVQPTTSAKEKAVKAMRVWA